MAPAAYHRIVEQGEDTERFHTLASRMVLLALALLAPGFSASCTLFCSASASPLRRSRRPSPRCSASTARGSARCSGCGQRRTPPAPAGIVTRRRAPAGTDPQRKPKTKTINENEKPKRRPQTKNRFRFC
jgi:hypothetical protein